MSLCAQHRNTHLCGLHRRLSLVIAVIIMFPIIVVIVTVQPVTLGKLGFITWAVSGWYPTPHPSSRWTKQGFPFKDTEIISASYSTSTL